MPFKTVEIRFRCMVLAALVMASALPARALDQLSFKRSTPVRQGRAWVQEAECIVPVREGGRLVARLDFGSLAASPGASDRVACRVRMRAFTFDETEARRYFDSYELSGRAPKEGTVYLFGRTASVSHGFFSLGVDVEISVPRRFNLDLETRSGNVGVEKLEGDLRAATGGGDIHIGDVNGNVYAATAGGNINLGNIGRVLRAETAGGNIHVGDVGSDARLETSGGEIVAGSVGGALRAETAAGDIVLRGASGPVRVETAGGQIVIGECAASVSAETAGGSIHLGGAGGKVMVETAGGSINLFHLQSAVEAATSAGRILVEISARRQSFDTSKLVTSAGDVQVYLPPNLPLTIDAAIDEAMAHQIKSEFPIQIKGADGETPPETLRGWGSLNGGGKLLRIRTETGDIEIRKLTEAAQELLQERQVILLKLLRERYGVSEQKPSQRSPE